MKQIDIIKTYAQKRCLVVDDLPESRTSLKRILIDYGANTVDSAGSAEEAIELCQKHEFDLVISDYNLGPGKDGQQLLEELRYQRLLKNTALFVMITAEIAVHQVLHALEYQPDDYLSKPVSRESLRPRLDQALLKNQALYPIKHAMDQRKPKAAIKACFNLMQKKDKYQNDARKILGELCINQKLYEQAQTNYQSIPENRRPVWAELGLARIEYGRGNFDQAEQLLQTIIETHPYCVEAMDLLAKVYERTYKLPQAQHILAGAIELSPNSTLRQREMGRVSSETGDIPRSIIAYRKAMKNGRNSCHESAGDAINLAEELCMLAREKSAPEARTLTEEAQQHLKSVDKKHRAHPIVCMRRLLLEANIALTEEQTENANKLTKKALSMHNELQYRVIGNTDIQMCIDCAKNFMALGEYDAGEKILQELSRINTDDDYAIRIDTLLREPKTPEGIAYAAKLNRQGIDHYQKHHVDAAVYAFKQVLRAMPNHIGLNLNLIQALISKEKNSPLNREDKALLCSCFQRIGNLDNDSKHQQRLTYLQKHAEHMRHE